MMKKLRDYLIYLTVALTMTVGVLADGFVNPQTEYFYKTPVTIQVEDINPSQGNLICVGIKYDGSTTFTPISDTLPNTGDVSFGWTPEELTTSATFGVFVNPDGTWEKGLTFGEFETSVILSIGTFNGYPVQMYKDGTYELVASFNPEELPETITLQYTIVGTGQWINIGEPINVSESYTYVINCNFVGDVKFRYVYNETDIVIAKTDKILVDNTRDTYFDFLVSGAENILPQTVKIKWQKSSNFPSINISYYHNGVYKGEGVYFEENEFELQNLTYGEWAVRGVAKSPGFEYIRTVNYNVINPCQEIEDSLANAEYRIDELTEINDELTLFLDEKNGRITVLEDSVIDLNGAIGELRTTIEELEIVISELEGMTNDTTININIDGTLVYENKLNDIPYPISYVDGIISIDNPIKARFDIYNLEGKLVLNGSIVEGTINAKELIDGMYILVIYNEDGSLVVYKFIR